MPPATVSSLVAEPGVRRANRITGAPSNTTPNTTTAQQPRPPSVNDATNARRLNLPTARASPLMAWLYEVREEHLTFAENLEKKKW